MQNFQESSEAQLSHLMSLSPIPQSRSNAFNPFDLDSNDASLWEYSTAPDFTNNDNIPDTLGPPFRTPVLLQRFDGASSGTDGNAGLALVLSPWGETESALLPTPAYNFPFQDFLNTGPAEVEDANSDNEPLEEGPVTAHRSRIRASEWEAYRRTLKKIYLDDNKSAKETREYMIKHHNFEASEKAYKNKFREWKWAKNLNVPAAQYMLSEAERRKRDSNKPTKFVMGGQHFTVDRIERFLQRSKVSTNGTISSIPELPTLATIRCFTPSTYSSPTYSMRRLPSATWPQSDRPHEHAPSISLSNHPPPSFDLMQNSENVPTGIIEPSDDEVDEQPAPTALGPPSSGEGRLEYAKHQVRLRNQSVEPLLLAFIADAHEGIERRLRAGALLMDLYQRLDKTLTTSLLLALKDLLGEAFRVEMSQDIDIIGALVALSGRFSLHARHKDAINLYRNVDRLAERELFDCDRHRIAVLVCFGRLLEQTHKEAAKIYLQGALSLALCYGHRCGAVEVLKSVCKQSEAIPVHGQWGMRACSYPCYLECELFDFEIPISTEMLDNIFECVQPVCRVKHKLSVK